MNKKVMIFGASGHAKVIADIIIKSKDILVGFLDDGIEKGTKVLGYEVLGRCEECVQYQDVEFIIGIGSNQIRKEIASKYQLKWYTAIHPQAIIGMDVKIDGGTVIMAQSVINSSANIGKHCIVNTGTIVEHDTLINDYVHLSPNTTICGNVHIGECTHIGANATVINNLNVTSNSIVGAGSVVIQDIKERGTYAGVPAKKLHE